MSNSVVVKKAKTWAIWIFLLVAISSINVFIRSGAVEFFARVIIIGGLFSVIAFFLVFAVMSLRGKIRK